jgi:hypothetical protein
MAEASWRTLGGAALVLLASGAPSQPPPVPSVTKGDEESVAVQTALQAVELGADTSPRLVKANGRPSDPRTIGVYFTVADPQLEGRTTELVVEVRFEPRVYVHSISWQERGRNRAAQPAPISEAYEVARAFAARKCEFWNDRRAVLVGAQVWAPDAEWRPIHDAEFAWEVEDGGAPCGHCRVGLNGSPLLPTLYMADLRPVLATSVLPLRALDLLPVAEAFCVASNASPALVQGVAFQPSRVLARNPAPSWGFAFWHTVGGGCLARAGCAFDATRAVLTVPEVYRDNPAILSAAEEVRNGTRTDVKQPPPPVRQVHPDDREAIAAAAEFLGLDPASLRGPVAWTASPGRNPRGLLRIDLPASDQAAGRPVTIELEAAQPYYVCRAEVPQAPGLDTVALPQGGQLWQVAWDFVQRHRQPWLQTLAGETMRLPGSVGERFWYHTTDRLVRTGTWVKVEARASPRDRPAPLYVSLYEARRAPEHGVGEMRVDLLEAVQVVRDRAQAQPGAIFLVSYGVPALSHPASPNQNPAWEIRYFVGPGGPEPIIRWAAVDATDGSLIYIDHDAPDTCFEGSI